MDDDKREEPDADGELEVDDLDLDEADAEAVKGGAGGEYDNGMQSGIKHQH